jgi:TldD protein
MSFVRDERTVATTEGAYFTQTLYHSGGTFRVTVEIDRRKQSVHAKGIATAGAGWELMLDAKIREQIPGLIDEATALLRVPRKPVEVGVYDVVCDAETMAGFVDATLSDATQLDRALGYEANAGGTSYLGPDPFTFLGTTLGAPLLNVTGDRSMPRGLATIKWDDEGVEPDQFALITNGTLVDYQTTREQAAWLAPWYQKQHRPIRSHGCARAESALVVPLQCTPNLNLLPGTSNIGFADLVANTKRGLAVEVGGAETDFQSRSGIGGGRIREITNGKLGAIIEGGGFFFDSMQFWKKLQAIGGASSRAIVPSGGGKGQPLQSSGYSVSAVPALVKDMALVDLRRKA